MTGADFRKWRDTMGATQAEVAAQFDVGQAYISKLERSAAIPRAFELALDKAYHLIVKLRWQRQEMARALAEQVAPK